MERKIDYYAMLLDIISKRKQFKSYAGSEGVAYLVSSKYVLKEYTKIEDWALFDKFFDAYCTEVQNFANNGVNIAKLYSWAKIPNIGYYTKGDKNTHHYYILEERVPGRELYLGYLEDAYHIMQDLCGEEEYNVAITKYGEESLYREILKRYLNDYVQMNEYLESLSDTQFEKFLADAYVMYKTGQKSYPDLFPHNILIDGSNSPKMIDMHIKTGDEELNPDNADSHFIRDMSGLFMYNCFPNKPEQYLMNDSFNYGEFGGVINKNIALTKQIIARFYAKLGFVCERPIVSRNDFAVLDDSLSLMLDENIVKELESTLIFE